VKLFQYWDSGDPPAEVAGWIDSVRRLNPDLDHRLYDEAAAAAYIAERLGDGLPLRPFPRSGLQAHRPSLGELHGTDLPPRRRVRGATKATAQPLQIRGDSG
jgi:hypothetical protein